MKKIIYGIVVLIACTIVADNKVQAQASTQASIYDNSHLIDTNTEGQRREIIKTNIYDHYYNIILLDNK